MANEMRKELKEKVGRALLAAEEKEGREIIATTLTPEQYAALACDSDLYAYKNRKCCLLYDGRYIDRYEGEEGKLHWRVLENVPADVLWELILGDHDEKADGRNDADHKDYKFEYLQQNCDNDGSDEGCLKDPWERVSYEQYCHPDDGDLIDYYHSTPEEIVLKEMGFGRKTYRGGDYPEVSEDNPIIVPATRFTGYGTYDRETLFQMKRVVCDYYRGLTENQQSDFRLIFASGMSQREMAELRYVTEQAIANRKQWFIQKVEERLIAAGFGDLIPKKQDLKKEKKAAASYAKHYETVSREIREEYFPEEEENIIGA